MQTIFKKSIDHYRRQKFLEEVNAAYAALRQDSGAWKIIEQERSQWDVTISDGLENDENWSEEGEVIPNNQGENFA